MRLFFLKRVVPLPTFALDMNAEEKASLSEHAAYRKAKRRDGEVLVFGPPWQSG